MRTFLPIRTQQILLIVWPRTSRAVVYVFALGISTSNNKFLRPCEIEERPGWSNLTFKSTVCVDEVQFTTGLTVGHLLHPLL